MKSIAIIVCYFGKFRKDFRMWLKSCEKNSTIDWIIFSDCEEQVELPKNVKIIRKTLQEIKQMAEEKLEIKIYLEEAYKLCDFKVAYGYIFKEYLKDYDYWGYCDLDMIFGDIRNFLNDNLLGEYDKYYQLGQLSIYANNYENNTRFMREGENLYYKKVFSNHNIFVFDEIAGIYQFYINNNWKMYINDDDYADINKYNKRLKTTIVKKNFKFQTFLWNDGKLYRIFEDNKGEIVYDELIYIHYSKKEFESIDSNSFFITNRGFINKNKDLIIDRNVINEMNPARNYIIEILEYKINRFKFRLKRKIKKIYKNYKHRKE